MFVLNMKVAWSVTRTTSFTGRVDPVQFPVVLVNEGSAWQTTSHTVIIPIQGYYFLHIGGGINSNRDLILYIVVNGGAHVIGVSREVTSSNGIDMTSSGGILHLNTDDVLKVASVRTGGAYSDQMKQTVFIGFLL